MENMARFKIYNNAQKRASFGRPPNIVGGPLGEDIYKNIPFQETKIFLH